MVKHLVDTDGDGRLIVNELMETKSPAFSRRATCAFARSTN